MPSQEKIKRRISRKKYDIGPIFVGGARSNATRKATYYRKKGFTTRIRRYKAGWRVFVY